jgi:hypothetical protein
MLGVQFISGTEAEPSLCEAHMKFGEAVRIWPTHVSFAKLQAIRDAYGHGTPVLKNSFHRAFMLSHLNVSHTGKGSV